MALLKSPTTGVQPLVALGIVPATIGGVLSAVATISVTYTLCVRQGVCPAFLPFISDTWDTPPGNYLSRIVIGTIAPLLATVQFALWIGFGWTSSTRSQAPSESYSHNVMRLALALTTCFALSIIAAICDNNDAPGCEGNVIIHGTAALTFFFGYSYVCIDYGLQLGDSISGNFKVAKKSALALLLCASVALKLRYFMMRPGEQRGVLDFPFIEVAEWADTAVLLLLTIVYTVAKASSYSIAVVQSCNAEAILPIIPCNYVWMTALSIYLFAAFGALVLTVLFGIVSIWPFPELSAIWTVRPGNFFSRWGLVQGGILFAISQVCLFYVTDPATHDAERYSSAFFVKPTLVRQVGLALSIFATFCLAIVGCIDDNENSMAHYIASIGAYSTYAIYILLTLIFGSSSTPRPTLSLMGGSAITCSTILVACRAWNGWMAAQVPAALYPLLEWLSFLLMVSFPGVVYYCSDVKEDIGVTLVSSSPSPPATKTIANSTEQKKPGV